MKEVSRVATVFCALQYINQGLFRENCIAEAIKNNDSTYGHVTTSPICNGRIESIVVRKLSKDSHSSANIQSVNVRYNIKKKCLAYDVT